MLCFYWICHAASVKIYLPICVYKSICRPKHIPDYMHMVIGNYIAQLNDHKSDIRTISQVKFEQWYCGDVIWLFHILYFL